MPKTLGSKPRKKKLLTKSPKNKFLNTKSGKVVTLKVIDGVSVLDLKDGRIYANGGMSPHQRGGDWLNLGAIYITSEKAWQIDPDGDYSWPKSQAIKDLVREAKKFPQQWWGTKSRVTGLVGNAPAEKADLSGSQWVKELEKLGLIEPILGEINR